MAVPAPATANVVVRVLLDLSAEVLEPVGRLLDVDTLFALSCTSRALRGRLHGLIEARCKRECFTTYLYPTVASYRMDSAVPATWRELYVAFSKLRRLRWSACKSEGTSSSLRTLKSDNQEYETDGDVRFLLRSGGHYWFSVLQTKINEATLGGVRVVESEIPTSESTAPGGDDGGESRAEPLSFLQSPQQITLGKWEKIRAAGRGPCPRRNHSMTCLGNANCPLNLMAVAATAGRNSAYATTTTESEDGDDEDAEMSVRRVVIFGGQSEGIPFEPFNDLYLLCIEDTKESDSRKMRAVWVEPNVTGRAPSPRCGHAATLLSPDLLLFSGGSEGVMLIPTLEVFILHIDGCNDFRWSTPSCTSEVPSGRSLHDVCRVSNSEVLIFGGRQIRQSNGLLDMHELKITTMADACGDNQHVVKWSSPRLSGSLPCSRRGHSTNSIGPNLLLFGGQEEGTGQLKNDVRVLDVAQRRWKRLDVPGDAPCPRRGFKNQYFGTSLVISSGFVRSSTAGRVDHQLADSDVHVLSLV